MISDFPVLVIAEIGVNHNGDIDLAKKLIDASVMAGANVVKFQSFDAMRLVTESAPTANYQSRNTGLSESQFELLRRLELPLEMHVELKKYAESQHCEFLSTGFDIEDLEFLLQLGIERIKIPSGEITNYPLLQFAAQQDLPIILSTGMSNIDECSQAIDVLLHSGLKKDCLTILQCTSAYPTPPHAVNLRAMTTLQRRFDVDVGFSDHSLSTVLPAAATALGAVVIEKHITLDRSLPGPDHAASLEPDEFSLMVAGIREVQDALGDGVKQPNELELETRHLSRKSIVFRQDVMKGTLIQDFHLTTRRPADGLSPMEWTSVVGSHAARDYQAGELFPK